MNRPKLTIIIPAFNEEEFIGDTLQSLAQQRGLEGNLLSRDLFQIVIVDNDSTDGTSEAVKRFIAGADGIGCYIINQKVKSVVASRIAGYNYVLHKPSLTTDLLASGDADVTFHPLWVYTVLKRYDADKFDILSNAGCFPLSFWMKVPNLVRRYLEEIGTIFFNRETIEWLGVQGQEVSFTEQVFFDFIRLATDQCFVITKDMYQRVRGYTQTFLDNGQEYCDEGGRLLAKVERTPAKIIYSNEAPYAASPRRVLNEPVKFLGGKLYFQGELEKDYRDAEVNAYQRLDRLALAADYSGIRKYVIKNYIILKCITRPELITKNAHYFGSTAYALSRAIENWWRDHPTLESGKEVIDFADLLTNKYYDQIMSQLPKQKVL
jgi:glycosyltransferase involved in cell wall biosynthesis